MLGAIPRNANKAKNAGNAKKTAGKILREEGLGRRVPIGSAESEAGPYYLVNPVKVIAEIFCNHDLHDLARVSWDGYVLLRITIARNI